MFSFLTTEANGVVGPVHPKTMPVLLTIAEEWRTWLEAPAEEALQLPRPLPEKMTAEAARGDRKDGAEDQAAGPSVGMNSRAFSRAIRIKLAA